MKSQDEMDDKWWTGRASDDEIEGRADREPIASASQEGVEGFSGRLAAILGRGLGRPSG